MSRKSHKTGDTHLFSVSPAVRDKLTLHRAVDAGIPLYPESQVWDLLEERLQEAQKVHKMHRAVNETLAQIEYIYSCLAATQRHKERVLKSLLEGQHSRLLAMLSEVHTAIDALKTYANHDERQKEFEHLQSICKALHQGIELVINKQDRTKLDAVRDKYLPPTYVFLFYTLDQINELGRPRGTQDPHREHISELWVNWRENSSGKPSHRDTLGGLIAHLDRMEREHGLTTADRAARVFFRDMLDQPSQTISDRYRYARGVVSDSRIAVDTE